MGWYAIDALQDALDETKAFLWPFDRGRWLRLAVIVFFVGGPGGSFGSGLQNASQSFGQMSGTGPESPPGAGFEQAIGEVANRPDLVAILALVAAVALLLLVVFGYLAAVFEFVFYRSLVDEQVRIRAGFRKYAWDGVKYALFRLALLLVIFGTIGAVIGALVLSPGLGFALILPAILLWLLLAVVGFFVHALAIPTMVVEETGFVEALRVTYRRVRGEWKQAGVYLLANVGISIAASVVVGIGMLIGIIALAIPLVILGLVLAALAPVLVAIPVLLGVVGLLVVYFAIAVPVQTYVYRWILDVHAGFAGVGDAG